MRFGLGGQFGGYVKVRNHRIAKHACIVSESNSDAVAYCKMSLANHSSTQLSGEAAICFEALLECRLGPVLRQ